MTGALNRVKRHKLSFWNIILVVSMAKEVLFLVQVHVSRF